MPRPRGRNFDYITSIRVKKESWKAFLYVCRKMGTTANALINSFVQSVIENDSVKEYIEQQQQLTNIVINNNINMNIVKVEQKQNVLTNFSLDFKLNELESDFALFDKIKSSRGKFVKINGATIGITQGTIVNNAQALLQKLTKFLEKYGRKLDEETLMRLLKKKEELEEYLSEPSEVVIT